MLVARSLSVDKERVTLQTLMTALFYDLSPEEEPWIPSQGERRERELRDLIRKGRKPVALFVDEAHDLHPKTLRGLKRLGEVVRDAGARLAVVLVGHPRLRNDLRRPTMEEIGHRTTIVDFKGIAGQQRPYIDWLLARCLAEGVAAGDVITEEAVELLARRLGTPLQIEQYLTSALEEGWRVGEKPVFTNRGLGRALVVPQLLLIFTFFYWPTRRGPVLGLHAGAALGRRQPAGSGFDNFAAVLARSGLLGLGRPQPGLRARRPPASRMGIALMLALLADRELARPPALPRRLRLALRHRRAGARPRLPLHPRAGSRASSPSSTRSGRACGTRPSTAPTR